MDRLCQRARRRIVAAAATWPPIRTASNLTASRSGRARCVPG